MGRNMAHSPVTHDAPRSGGRAGTTTAGGGSPSSMQHRGKASIWRRARSKGAWIHHHRSSRFSRMRVPAVLHSITYESNYWISPQASIGDDWSAMSATCTPSSSASAWTPPRSIHALKPENWAMPWTCLNGRGCTNFVRISLRRFDALCRYRERRRRVPGPDHRLAKRSGTVGEALGQRGPSSRDLDIPRSSS